MSNGQFEWNEKFIFLISWRALQLFSSVSFSYSEFKGLTPLKKGVLRSILLGLNRLNYGDSAARFQLGLTPSRKEDEKKKRGGFTFFGEKTYAFKRYLIQLSSGERIVLCCRMCLGVCSCYS